VYRPVVGWRPDVNGVAPTNASLIADGFTRIDPATGQVQRQSNGAIVTYRTKLGGAAETPITGWQNIALLDENPADPTTMRQFYERSVLAGSISPIQQLDGQRNPNVREWRANMSTTYAFSEGRLRGLSVGGSLRFRDAAVVGFASKPGADGSTVVSDITRPHFNEDEMFVDAMLSYRGRSRPWGVAWKLQVNVRNLTDNADPYPVQSDSRGIGRVWAVFEPRTWIFSCQFDL
jgi:hypothetical protein